VAFTDPSFRFKVLMHNSRFAFARRLAITVACSTLLAAPRVASAQFSVAGFLGAELDNKDNWLLFGAEARVSLKQVFDNNPIDGSARFSYHSYGSGSSATQIDLNLLAAPELAHPGRFQPYMGAGLAFLSTKFAATSETKVGLNLVSGVRLKPAAGSIVEPFMNMQYSIINDYPNPFTISLGLSFHVR
jgi:hypothetical protein